MAITPTTGIPDRGPPVFWITAVTIMIATIFVAARLYCRIFIVRNFSIDDKLLVAAWVISAGLSTTVSYGTSRGLGRHDVDIGPQDEGIVRRTEYVFSILYNPALMATKTSILMFYLRLGKNTNATLRMLSWVCLGIINISGILLTFMNIFQCRPIKSGWGSWEEGQRCIPLLTEFICATPVNVITDIAILFLPLPVLTAMKLPTRQKGILIGTFMLGIFVTVVDIIRIYFLQGAISRVPSHISSDPEASFGGQPEFSWQASKAIGWSMIEVNIGLICSCIPTLKPLFSRFMPMVVGDHNYSTSSVKSIVEPLNLHRQKVHESTGSAATDATLVPSQNGGSHGMSMTEFLVENTDIREGDFAQVHDRRERAITLATMNRVTRAVNNRTGTSIGPDKMYFGFVKMKRPKSLVQCSVKDSWKYCSIVCVLFFIWGASYGFLNTLNNVVALVAGMTTAETLSLSTMYFGAGYILGPLTIGTWLIRRDEHQLLHHKTSRGTDRIGGFKIVFMTGLYIYGTGTMVFWPCAVMASLAGFLVSNFIVGFGLSILEAGANSFLILCGPEEYAEMRLMLAQAVQATGSVFANLVAKRVFFPHLNTSNIKHSNAFINVQWTYLAITLFCAFLAMFFYYMPIPEVSDLDLSRVAQRCGVKPRKKHLFNIRLRTLTISAAVLCQFCYTAGQGSMQAFYVPLLMSMNPKFPQTGPKAIVTGITYGSDPPAKGFTLTFSDTFALFQSLFAIGRYTCAGVLYASTKFLWLPKPRTLVMICVVGVMACGVWMATWHPSNYQHICVPVALCYFFMGPIWPLVFTMGLRNQGIQSKAAGCLLTMAASGPVVSLWAQWGIIENGGTVSSSFFFLVGVWSLCFVFPCFVSFSSDAKMMVDPLRYHQFDHEQGVKPEVEKPLPSNQTLEGSEGGDVRNGMEAHDHAVDGLSAPKPVAKPQSWEDTQLPEFVRSAI